MLDAITNLSSVFDSDDEKIGGGGGGGWRKNKATLIQLETVKNRYTKNLYFTVQFTRSYAYRHMVLVSVTLVTQNWRVDLPVWSK